MVGHITLSEDIIRAKAELMGTCSFHDYDVMASVDPYRFTADGLLLFVEAILREYEKERELSRKFPSRRTS